MCSIRSHNTDDSMMHANRAIAAKVDKGGTDVVKMDVKDFLRASRRRSGWGRGLTFHIMHATYRERPRTWRERLFSFPWVPHIATVAQAEEPVIPQGRVWIIGNVAYIHQADAHLIPGAVDSDRARRNQFTAIDKKAPANEGAAAEQAYRDMLDAPVEPFHRGLGISPRSFMGGPWMTMALLLLTGCGAAPGLVIDSLRLSVVAVDDMLDDDPPAPTDSGIIIKRTGSWSCRPAAQTCIARGW